MVIPTLHIEKRGLYLNLAAQDIFKRGCELIYLEDGRWIMRHNDRFTVDNRGRLTGSDFTAWLMKVTTGKNELKILKSIHHDFFRLVDEVDLREVKHEKVKKQRVQNNKWNGKISLVNVQQTKKLDYDDILLIRFLGSSISRKELAEMFDIDKSTIRRILTFKLWKNP